MTALRVLLARLAALRRGRARDDALGEEIDTHLSLLTDEFIARGLTSEDARLAARRAFGGVDQVRSHCRDERGLPSFDAAVQDLQLAARSLVRDPGFAVTTLLVLGLGIGVTHMFLTIVYAHTMRGLPVARPDRLLYVSTLDDRNSDRPLTRTEFERLRDYSAAFDPLVGFIGASVTLGDEGRVPDRVEAAYVGRDAFAAVGSAAILGRDFEAADHRPGAAAVAILGRTVWRSRYDEASDIVGRTVLVNGRPVTIVGILPDASGFPSTAAVWLPLASLQGLAEQPAGLRSLRVVGRLGEGAAVAEARAEAEAAIASVAAEQPAPPRIHARVVPVNERLLGRLEGPWLAFLIAGSVIIVIACANVGNLLLARGFTRAREMAVRTALGASRGRIVRQLLVESLVIATAGGIVGLAVSLSGVRLFSHAIPAGTLPYWLDYSIDVRLLSALVVLSTASAVAFGLVPALLISRTDLQAVLRDGGRSHTASRGSRPWMTVFLAVEIGLAVVLLATVATSSLALRARLPADEAVQTTDVVTAGVTLPPERFATPDARRRLLGRLMERVRAVPRITSVSLTAALPLAGGAERALAIDGGASVAGNAPTVIAVEIGPAYFRTLGLSLVRGREFGDDDAATGVEAALVNARFVERFLPGRDPIGIRFSLSSTGGSPDPGTEGRTIVGIVPDLRQRARPSDAEPIVYLPVMRSPPPTTTLVVRAPGVRDAAALVRAEAREVDPLVPLYRAQTLAQAIRDAEWNPRVSMQLANTLTCLCVLLATVGLYAVTAHGVSQRQRELGIRVALGATPWRVARLVVNGTRLPIGLGLLLGVLGALAWERAFPPARADLSVGNPLVLTGVTALIAVVAAAGCLGPVRRAARVDPVSVLCGE